MQRNPFSDHSQRFRWKIAFQNFTGHIVYSRNVIIVNCMNMLWIMFTLQKIHTNDNSIES